ncbi:hypothetical protein SANTM175S_03107 [Streptomyces antimycoticus]
MTTSASPTAPNSAASTPICSPKQVGRAALDAVVDPTEDPEQGSYGQAKGFQLALDNYLKDCAKKGAACPTGGDPAAGTDRIVDFLKRLDKKPLSTQSGRKLTQDGALSGIAAALYDKESWKYLTLGAAGGDPARRRQSAARHGATRCPAATMTATTATCNAAMPPSTAPTTGSATR